MLRTGGGLLRLDIAEPVQTESCDKLQDAPGSFERCF
tara:strand:- start:10168 stop:10278 length:111 start_codon:yes stop_codon:yes gene_type:complete